MDTKVGPSEHLPRYVSTFGSKFISYSRGNKATARYENQCMGTMEESDEMRKLYASKFNGQLKQYLHEYKTKQEMKWCDNITNWHGRALTMDKLAPRTLDAATQDEEGKELNGKKGYTVTEPGGSGSGPFRVYKPAGVQTNQGGANGR